MEAEPDNSPDPQRQSKIDFLSRYLASLPPFPSGPVADVLFGRIHVPVSLYSLDATFDYRGKNLSLPRFRDFVVLGCLQLTASEAADALVNSVTDIDANRSLCAFEPRHGIKFEESGKQYEILLCYECGDLIAWCDNEHVDAPHGNFRQSVWHFKGVPDQLNATLDASAIPRDWLGKQIPLSWENRAEAYRQRILEVETAKENRKRLRKQSQQTEV